MKDKLMKPKYFLSLGTIAFSFIIGLSYSYQGLGGDQIKLHNANSGLNICFQRVSQSFTALMIRDVKSSYLGKSFRASTGECLQEVSNSLSKLGDNVSKGAILTLNNLKSDLHWFDKKVDRVNDMASKGEIDISQSNITDKYSELEGMKSSLEDKILSNVEKIEGTKAFTLTAMILAQLGFVLSGLSFFFYRRIKGIEVQQTEEISLDLGQEDPKVILRKIESTLRAHSFEKTSDFLFSHIKNLESENQKLSNIMVSQNQYSDSVYEIPLKGIEKEDNSNREVSDFSVSLNTILDNVKTRAFNDGIILDTNLADEFSIYAEEEVLQQTLSALINYSMEQASYSQQERKVTLRSKSLGGIAYCKVIVAGHKFLDEELELFNGGTPTPEMSLNLVLLKEMCKDANFSIALKNKQNSSQGKTSSEIELIFDRAKVKAVSLEKVPGTKESIKVVKGKKSDILNFLNA